MTTHIPHYERREVNGRYTTVEIDLEPGRTALVPMLTSIIGTPTGDAMIRLFLEQHEFTKDVLRDAT